MGDWHISIQGTGCHHNPGEQADDANRMAESFVHQLRAAGHRIESASFTHGGRDLINTVPATGPSVRVTRTDEPGAGNA